MTGGGVARRTAVGAATIAAAAALVWAADAAGEPRVVLFMGALLGLGLALELGRMGALAARGADLVVATAALGVTIAIERGMGALARQAGAARIDLVSLYGVAAFGGLLAFAALGVLRRGRVDGARGRAVAFVVLGAAQLVLLEALALAERHRLALAGAVALAAALAWLAAPRWAPHLGSRRRELAIALGLALWAAAPMPLLGAFWLLHGTAGLVALLVVAKVGDTAAYYVGRAIGRRRPFPSISPGKTVAGFVSSALAGTAAGAGAAALGAIGAGVAAGAALGLATNVAAQAGDLVESWVKRRAGVKDSARWLGPAGGLADALDSLLVAVPIACLLWPASGVA